jgi:hypothetical protein
MGRRQSTAVPERIMKIIHRRDAEFTEKNFKISEFEFPTLGPQRLRGESLECFVIFVRFVVGIIDGE